MIGFKRDLICGQSRWAELIINNQAVIILDLTKYEALSQILKDPFKEQVENICYQIPTDQLLKGFYDQSRV